MRYLLPALIVLALSGCNGMSPIVISPPGGETGGGVCHVRLEYNAMPG